MEFRAELKDGISGPARAGAGAVRELAAALGGAGGAVKGLGGRELELATAGQAVQSSLDRQQTKLARLEQVRKAAESSGSSDIEAGRALAAEIEETVASVTKLSTALSRAGVAGRDFNGEAAAQKKATDEQQKVLEKQEREEEKAFKRKEALEKKQERDELARLRRRKEAKETLNKGAELASRPLATAASFAGVNSGMDLARLAVGWRGMARLQMTAFRAQQDVRRLFTGLDTSPLIHAADKLERNLSKSTVTGTALSGILQRGFSAVFQLLDRPEVEAFFQGMVLGALEMEIAFKRTEIALFPLTDALDDAIGPTDRMTIAAYAGAAALGVMGIAATVAAIPYIAVAAAVVSVATAIRQLLKLWDEFDAKRDAKSFGAQALKDGFDPLLMAARAAGLRKDEDPLAGSGVKMEKLAPTAPPPGMVPDGAATAARGSSTGRALGDGIVVGMKETEAAVKDGGKALALAANDGAREGAKAHSPSELTKALGHDLGDGVIVGMDERAPGVQAAAERSLVPELAAGGGPRGGGASSAPAAAPIHIELHAHFPELRTADRADLDAAHEAAGQYLLRQVTLRLGLPLQSTGAT